jgi:hypothetical protein
VRRGQLRRKRPAERRLTGSRHQQADAWVEFRKRIIRALSDGFLYIDADTFIATCPACTAGHVRVFFHGTAERADLTCSLGCAEADIARAVGGLRRRA